MCYSGLCSWEDHEGNCQWPGWYKKGEGECPCPSPEEMAAKAEELEKLDKQIQPKHLTN